MEFFLADALRQRLQKEVIEEIYWEKNLRKP
jgi:hypothetical protein